MKLLNKLIKRTSIYKNLEEERSKLYSEKEKLLNDVITIITQKTKNFSKLESHEIIVRKLGERAINQGFEKCIWQGDSGLNIKNVFDGIILK